MSWIINTPPLTHLRLLDCVEMQGSAKYFEDHIQAMQDHILEF
jgi:hypothetical protein